MARMQLHHFLSCTRTVPNQFFLTLPHPNSPRFVHFKLSAFSRKLLRDVQPELMDALIQASKDGDCRRLQELSASVSQSVDVYDEEVEDDDEEESNSSIEIASKWFDGLTTKDIGITNEIYSIHSTEFDRQDLRKLVRNVHYFQEQLNAIEGDNGLAVALARAEKSLTQFLRSLARQLPDE